jgi:hypothetical protein
MSILLGTVALVLGAYIAVSPTKAARIWGWQQFDSLAPKRRALYLWAFRAMGIVICLGGALTTVQSIWFH